MYIMTANGWKQLSPKDFTPAPTPVRSNGVTAPYEGKLPSAELCACFNQMKNELKYFDDGVRMQYGKPDRYVETDNAAPIHPIKNPPKGFWA